MATSENLRVAQQVLNACVDFLKNHALEQSLANLRDYAIVTKENADLLTHCVGMKLKDIVDGNP